MFLDLTKFLAHFPAIKITKEQFAKKFTVMYAKPQSLHDILNQVPGHKGRLIIKDTTKDKRWIKREEMIEYFYEIIIRNRKKYLTCFYEAYFAFKDPYTMKWSNVNLFMKDKESPDGEMVPAISLQKNDASRRMIRNLFYLELLDLTQVTNTVKCHVSFWGALDNMYNKLQLEDRFFAPSSIDLFLRDKGTKREERTGIREINYNNLFYLLQAYQPKASIFNPYSIKWIMDNVIDVELTKSIGRPGQTMFTPVLSWGSYMAAFMHSNYKEYVGVDVMPSVCHKVEFLADWYNKHPDTPMKRKTKIYCQPSETLLKDKKFQAMYKSHFDVILVCPPYFDMEVYHEGPQSLELYPSYWEATVHACSKCTRKGGIFAMIANDYKALDGSHHPLTKDLDSRVRKYYTPLSIPKYYLQNRTSPLRVNAKDRTERLFLYKLA